MARLALLAISTFFLTMARDLWPKVREWAVLRPPLAALLILLFVFGAIVLALYAGGMLTIKL